MKNQIRNFVMGAGLAALLWSPLLMAQNAETAEIPFDFHAGHRERVGELVADPARLQQVFWNILKNAAKFTPDRGEIFVKTTRLDDGRYQVEFRDTGVGIEPEALGRVFTAFEQGHQLINRRYGGLGLGLAIARALVHLHGGTIEARSEGTGKGTLFVENV